VHSCDSDCDYGMYFGYYIWLDGTVARELELQLEIAGSVPGAALSSSTFIKFFTDIASVKKQYNLVLA